VTDLVLERGWDFAGKPGEGYGVATRYNAGNEARALNL
jgi:hypothetical protein